MRITKKLLIFLLFLSSSFVSWGQYNIKGIVASASDGTTLPGVNVVVKGTKIGVATDIDGKYSITVPGGKNILVFSQIGMKTLEKAVTKSGTLNIKMFEDVSELGEIVVTGITTTDKRLFTGASEKLKAKDIVLKGLPDISRALEGRSGGVSVQNVSGTFGTAPKIRIRGATSIYGSSKPLWVVDGVVLEDVVDIGPDQLSSGDAATLISSAISGLNSDDIESFDILKDGSATSIYGARAMAGVIVITTKKGRAGVSSINYSTELTYRLIPSYDDFNVMNSQEQMSFCETLIQNGWITYEGAATDSERGVYGRMYSIMNKLDKNGNFLLKNTPKSIAAFLRKAEYRNTDWFKELFNNNVMQSHSISMSSGTKKSGYYASLSALVDPGWTLESNVNRYTANLNSYFNIKDNLKLIVNSNASYRKQKAPGTLSQDVDVVSGKVKRDFDINPYSFALNSSRALDPDVFYTRNYADFNIKHELKNNYIDLNVVDVKFQGQLKWKLTPEIELSALGALKYVKTGQEHHTTEFSNQANAYRAMDNNVTRESNPYLYKNPDNIYAIPISVLPQGGIYREQNRSMLGYDFRSTTSYKNSFDDNMHIVNLFAGMEINSSSRKTNRFTGWGLQYDMGEIPFYTYEIFKKGIEDNNNYYGMYNTRYRNVAFFGNATYSFKGKYTINGTLRYEGTNKMGKSPRARWLPTWNLSGAWHAHEEPFFESLTPALSNFTLKTSYSLTADRGPSYVTNSLVDIRSSTPWKPSASLKESALYIASLENSELTYEKKHELNIGVEIGFLNNRISTTFDYYTRNNYDLIGRAVTQGVGGKVKKFGNIATMKSYGFEVSLTSKNIKTTDFSWTTSLVYSHTKNKITSLKTSSRVIDLIKGSGFAREGYNVRSIFSIPFKGLNSEGLPTFLDQRGDISVDKIYFQEREKLDFLEYSGSSDPTDFGSLGNIFTYKGIKLNVFMTYSFGNVVRLRPVFSNYYTDLDALPREFKDRWTVPGDEKITNVPTVPTRNQDKRLKLRATYNAYNYSSARIAKGDFIRLKELSLAYDLPKSITSKLKINSMGFKLQATNLFLLYADDKLNGQDPEFFNSGGVAVPLPKQITFTLNVGL